MSEITTHKPEIIYVAVPMTHPRYGCWADVHVNGSSFAHLYGSTEGATMTDVTFRVRDTQWEPEYVSCEYVAVTVQNTRLDEVLLKLALIQI